jgi:hypothetical protein
MIGNRQGKTEISLGFVNPSTKPPVATRSRPILRPVENTRNFDRVFCHPIHGDVRQWRKGKLAPLAYASAAAAHVGKILELAATLIDDFGNAPRGFGIVLLDPRANAPQGLLPLAGTNVSASGLEETPEPVADLVV